MYPFEYHRAESVDQASEMMRARPHAEVLARGMSLVPMLKSRLVETLRHQRYCLSQRSQRHQGQAGRIEICTMTAHAVVAASPIPQSAARFSPNLPYAAEIE